MKIIMAWLVVSKSGTEYIFKRKPRRKDSSWTDETVRYEEKVHPSTDGYYTNKIMTIDQHSSGIKLPEGTIYKLIGKELTWKDKPFKFDHICG